MNRYADGQTFLGEHAFILDNLTQDPSMVRETVTMKLFARLGIPAPRESHVRLYVNNSFAGVYAAVEEIDKRFLARIYGIVAEDTQNDGYLFEFNFVDPWYFTYLGSDLEQYKLRFEAKTKENKSDQEKYGPIEELVRLVNDAAGRSSTCRCWASGSICRRSMRYVAAQAYVAQNDGFLGYAGMNNFYFYRLEDRRSTCSSPGTRTTRSTASISRSPTRTGRERADAEGDAGAGAARGLQRRAARRDRVSRRADRAQTACRGSSTRCAASSISCRSAIRDDQNKPYTVVDHEAARTMMLDFAQNRSGSCAIRCGRSWLG